jgi:hypothetical protein
VKITPRRTDPITIPFPVARHKIGRGVDSMAHHNATTFRCHANDLDLIAKVAAEYNITQSQLIRWSVLYVCRELYYRTHGIYPELEM